MNREYNPCINTGGGGELYAYKCTHNIHLHYHDNKCVLKILCVPLLSPGKKNKVRVYYLAWLRNKILHNDPEVEKKQGWVTVGDLEGCVHYKVGTSHPEPPVLRDPVTVSNPSLATLMCSTLLRVLYRY